MSIPGTDGGTRNSNMGPGAATGIQRPPRRALMQKSPSSVERTTEGGFETRAAASPGYCLEANPGFGFDARRQPPRYVNHEHHALPATA